jgi:hypothetical protein
MARERHAKGAMERQRDRFKEFGLVQINAWVPADKRNEILEDCARLRWQHLKHNGYLERDEEPA